MIGKDTHDIHRISNGIRRIWSDASVFEDYLRIRGRRPYVEPHETERNVTRKNSFHVKPVKIEKKTFYSNLKINHVKC